MAISYRPYEPQQEMLLPASLQDWLLKGHLALMVKLLVYGSRQPGSAMR
ncbi:hypothetical protein [Rhodoferax sediminis]|nr:hypothetical protein [Rhodoferax sediminis]